VLVEARARNLVRLLGWRIRRKCGGFGCSLGWRFQKVNAFGNRRFGVGYFFFQLGWRLSMIRHLSAVGLGFGIACVSSAAFAQSSSGLALGLRAGYAIPMGKEGTVSTTNGSVSSTSTDKVADDISGMVPIWLDVGYRVNPAVYVGAFFQYGFASVNKDHNPTCSQGFSCSAHDIAFGANVHYHILPEGQFDPWVGAGLGYELLTANVSGSASFGGTTVTADATQTLKGFQFLVLEAGGDFKATPAFGVGPFVNFSLGQYSSWSSSVTSGGTTQDESGDVQDKGMHEWLTIGLRGQYDL
jgi:outer membrane protein W